MVPAVDLPHLFAWAQQHALALFPIPKFCKRPTGIVESHATGWSRDPGQWRRWWEDNAGCNFGVECGPSRIIVVDEDPPKIADGFAAGSLFSSWLGLPDSVILGATVRTPTGGFHYYFMTTGIDSEALRQPDVLPKRINVRAGRGYVVSPWSCTDPAYDSGVKARGSYWILQGSFHSAPQKLLDHCAPHDGVSLRKLTNYQPGSGSPIGPEDIVYGPRPSALNSKLYDNGPLRGLPIDPTARHGVIGRSEHSLRRLREAMPGERNVRLNDASFALGKLVAEGLLDEGRAEEMVWDAAAACGIPRDEAKARSTVRSGMRAAPRVGHAEPRSAMAELLAYDVPVAAFSRPVRRPRGDGVMPPEPVVSRLLFEGDVTVLSGGSGSGKTTFAASLAAASTTDVRHFQFGSFEDGLSDVACRTAVWIFVSYEGGQYITRNVAAWYKGMGIQAAHPKRFVSVVIEDGPLIGTVKREAFAREGHVKRINEALDAAMREHPELPVVVVIDNVTSAVENSIEPEQASMFMRTMKAIAAQGAAVLVLGHPTKDGASPVYGSHILFSIADIVGKLEVLRRDGPEWVQWLSFGKHRLAMNGECLEVRSRRLAAPLVDLPPGWLSDHPRERERAIRDLHLPYVRQIKVRPDADRQSASSGVVEHVTEKPAATMKF